MNDTPFEYEAANGTKFTCERCDFKEVINVKWMHETTDADFHLDIAEMIGYHAINVHPQLNGFQGYDVLNFEYGGFQDGH